MRVGGQSEHIGFATFNDDIYVTGLSTFVGIATFQSVDINNGAIDGTNIGFYHRDNGQFVNLDATGTLGVDGTSTLNTLNVTGISTFLGSVGIGTTDTVGAAKTLNTTVLNAGIVTAAYFYGDGSGLTNLSLIHI